MKWRLERGLWLLAGWMVASCAQDKQYAPPSPVPSAHLDAALHHYDTLHVNDINHTSSPDHLFHSVSLSTLDRHFHMILEWDSNIVTKDFAVYSVDGEGRRHLYEFDQRTFLHGHLKGEKTATVVAHLPDSGVLTAVITTPTDTYHIEPSQHYIKEPHPFHMVAYARSHVKERLNATRLDYTLAPTLSQQFPSKHRIHSDTARPTHSNRLRRQSVNRWDSGEQTTCNMALVADFSAFMMFGSMEGAASQMVMLLSSVDREIYRPTAWSVDLNDNSVNGLGHSAQMILVHTATSQNRMNYNRADTNSDAGEILGLMRFGPWSGFCLAHLLTNRNFPSGLLGLANVASPLEGQTGGICSKELRDFSIEPPESIIYNTGLSSYNNNGEQMVMSEMIRVVGHELGHNWGSHHDPNTDQCDGYLMNEYAQDGSQDSHMTFSICSRRSIGEVLVNKADACFTERRTVCGDFQVDATEQCDAGPDGDQCCNEQCKLTEDSQCSDVNSPCCEGCVMANASVVCRTRPRISIDCTAETLCNGVNSTCLNTPEPAQNGTRCRNGICMLNDTTSLTECIPLCKTMDMNYSMCTCEGQDECKVCCEGPGRVCTPILAEGSSEGFELLANGSFCRRGVCRSGVCSSTTQDQVTRIWTIIVSLNASAFRQFIDENIVGFTLIFSIPIWCIGSCLLYWLVDYPRKKRFEDAIDKAGSAVFVNRKNRPSGKKHSERKPLLAEEEEREDFSVDEPEDDLPPPKY